MNILNVGYDSTNYYLIEQNKKRLLVDVGFPGTLPKLLAILKRKDVSLGDVDYLFNTHYHPDHAGLVQELKNKGVKHIVLQQQLASVPNLRMQVKPDSGFLDIRLRDSITLSIEQSRSWLASIGMSGEMVSTPGHSDDSITLVLDEGVAFTGDFPHPMMVDESTAEIVQEGWNKLRSLKVSRIYPGHGPTARPIF